MAEMKIIVVKTDLTTEIVKTLAKGRRVEFDQVKHIGNTVDIGITISVPRSEFTRRTSAYQITAREIYEIGTDQAFCRAIERCNGYLDKET